MEYSLTVAPTARTGRLLLRPWAVDDVPALVAAHRDPEMTRWLRTVITSEAQALEVITSRQAAMENGSRLAFAILEGDSDGGSGEIVGNIGLRGLDHGTGCANVGYWVRAAARGRGIAPLALEAICEWAFRLPRAPRLNSVVLIHATGNRASCRVAEKAGFELAEVLPPAPPEFPHEGHLHVRVA